MDTATYEKSYSKYISTKIYQYELQTALYMLEPWEKALFSKQPSMNVWMYVVGLTLSLL
jgi:hypothetical protein